MKRICSILVLSTLFFGCVSVDVKQYSEDKKEVIAVEAKQTAAGEQTVEKTVIVQTATSEQAVEKTAPASSTAAGGQSVDVIIIETAPVIDNRNLETPSAGGETPSVDFNKK